MEDLAMGSRPARRYTVPVCTTGGTINCEDKHLRARTLSLTARTRRLCGFGTNGPPVEVCGRLKEERWRDLRGASSA
eukprot:CAMPEP_0194536124 /NCGR_PEP_ID=MMETSP0253-20130528/74924_1 /TAXON_ID=2966 /ORGANISM="Noctiluca scintillans" /LENGTH=76 /DNA_ID=CAMNT_0039382005 /DNA_START=58 /DNA_END=284 /DNA_ORIENTATION=+